MRPEPAIAYPPDLPVSGQRERILEALRSHQVVVVAGATGSGKTTQLPKMLMELGKTRIAHTQPRRIAARAVAERIAAELGEPIGGTVGYRVRFTDRASSRTRLTVMTDGILLNAIHRDPDLAAYDAIIIDEAHERSLTIDFLLGYLRRLLPSRPDLTVVVTSATIDPASFARHFAFDDEPAPVIEVSGRTYPVEVRYRPLVGEATVDDDPDAGLPDRDLATGILDALTELAAEPPGDVLVFCSGEGEIRDALDAVQGAALPATEVLPLYGRLSAADQHRVFDTRRAPGVRRRVVLATNVAETSLTVPGIRYVVDGGTARISRWSARTKVQRLPIEPISRASAAQRAGRSGREAPGIAIRLYAEDDFASRPEFTEPEILRTDLAAVLLQMAALGLGDADDFPFLTPPDRRGVRDGMQLLAELGAVDAAGRITRVGRRIARLPLDPRLGRMLVAAEELGVAGAVIPIVAGLSVQDPRERPEERRAAADQAHARHVDPTSDFVTLLRLWRHLQALQRELSGNRFRRRLKAEFLHVLRVREWQDVVRQLERSLGHDVDDAVEVNALLVHQAILAGLLARIGVLDRTAKSGDRRAPREYLGARGARFAIHPSSALAARRPDAIMSAELVETSRLFARMNAEIDPAWAERWAGDLVVRSYSEPRWERRRGEVVADERVTLYGVPIVARRPVRYGRIDREHARELFIRHALVAGEWDTRRLPKRLTAFLAANAAVRERVAEVEERARRRDLLVGDEAVVDWYRARLPLGVESTVSFQRWWAGEQRERPELLTMRVADFVDEREDAGEALDPARFPPTWTPAGGAPLPVVYRHAPGAADDGMTLVVPRERLAGLDASGLDWLVPGMREALAAALIKTLPKVIRREVVPAAAWAARLLPELPEAPDGRPFTVALAAAIKRVTFAPASAADFDLTRLPDHFLANVRVVDAGGRVLGEGRDLAALRVRFAAAPRAGRDTAGRGAPTAGRGAPQGASRDPSPQTPAGRGAPQGASRDPSPAALAAFTAYAQERLTPPEKLALATSPYPSTARLVADCVRVVGGGDAADPDRVLDVVVAAAAALAAAGTLDRAVREASATVALMPALLDVRAQVAALVHPGFIAVDGLDRLRRLPVYLAGAEHRVRRLPERVGRDRAWQSEAEEATRAYREAHGDLPLTASTPPQLASVRWMLEELRLTLFAQHLPAAGPVSLKRIRAAL